MKNIETLDLDNALKHVISLIVQLQPKSIMLLTSTHERSNFVWTQFEDLLNTVPTWLVPGVASIQRRMVRFETGTVFRIGSDHNALRGLIIHHALIDVAFKEDKEALMYILPTLVREPNSTAYWVIV